MLVADAETGILRKPLNENEALEIAKASFSDSSKVSKIKHLVNTNGHHEYWEAPLPAYAFTFNQPSNTTI